jgi:chromosome segregation ATPase
MEKFEASERAIQHLENKITRYRNEAIKARNVIYQLEKDREKYGVQASDAQAKLMTAHEEMKLRENQIGELEKKETDLRGRLKHQQQMYEAVRADRNLYSKHLIEAQDEIAEMRRKFKIMNHQIEQLKEEITAKDRALVAEHFEHQSVEKRLDQSTHEIERLRKQLSDSQQAIGKQDAEIAELNTTIRRMDADMLRQKKEYDQMTTERDILGTQLIRRNDELALLYEKVKIQQSTLRKGEAQYQNRMQDIRMLKLKIGDLRRELHIAKRQAGRLGDVKREVYRLQRELLQEKTKVKALSEELENPMNVHRWRKLEGSDPATYEMIQKIQTLQKRLISKTEEVVEKELLIQEKEKLYVELKNILARQPGPEVAEQLSVYQQNLKEKTRQMKAMASELNMYQAQINEYKYEIERLTRELHDVKRKYYDVKRKDAVKQQKAVAKAQASRKLAAQQAAVAQGSAQRFAGGGFNMTQA